MSSIHHKLNKFLFSFLIVAIAGILPVFATVDDDVAMIRAILYNTTSGQAAMYSQVANIYARCNTYLPSLNDIKTACNSIDSKLTTTNSNLASIIQGVNSQNTYLSNIQTSSSTSASNTSNILSGLSATLPDIHDSVVQLQEVLASDEDLAIRQSQASRVDQINDDFLDSSGDASVSLGDLGSAKNSVSELKDAVSGGASSSQLWGIFTSSSDGWAWFSNDTLYSLDPSSNTRRSSSGSYDYLQSYYDEVYSHLGVRYND